MYGCTPYRINGAAGYKIQLIKKIGELGGTPTFSLKERKEIVERYFDKWC